MKIVKEALILLVVFATHAAANIHRSSMISNDNIGDEMPKSDDAEFKKTKPPARECPSEPPYVDVSCSIDTPTPCKYDPYQCVGEDTDHYNTWCYCEDGKFLCDVAKPYCENGFLTDPPTMEPKETKPPAKECPSKPPYVDVSCSVETPTPCMYDPYKCVGDDTDSYSTWCYCRNGKFQCDVSKPNCTTCIECSNNSSNAMKKKGKTCDGMTKLDTRCRRKRWKNKNICQRSCYEAGFPYNGETCC